MPKTGASSKPSKPPASPSKPSPSKSPPPTPTLAKAVRTPSSPAPLVVRRDHVEVQDPVQATRLYQKGFIGDPQPGNRLRLSLVEAAWLCTQGRLDLPGGAAGLLAHGAAQGNGTEVEFLAYSDLRARGLVVRHDASPVEAGAAARAGLRVWPRGQGPPRAHDYLVQVCAEGDVVSDASLLAAAAQGALLAVVDQDGAVTHYKVEAEAPRGQHPPGDLPRTQGVLLADRVLVPDAGAARAYAEKEFLGTQSPAGLVLSLTEAASLMDRGVLQLARVANKADPTLVRVYDALRGAGVVVKSGFRFGTHLRGYEGDPEAGHAQWLIHCLAGGDAMHWSELSRGIRLAHGVRKRFLVAIPDRAGVAFVALSWFKP